MRAFLGIEPDATTKLAIESWRSRVFPPFNQSVPAANYHITLAFLGHINLEQQEKLEQQIELLEEQVQFSVHLDLLGFWPKPKALWLGCSLTARPHINLVHNLIRTVHFAGIPMQKRDYQAHLTIVRKCSDNPPEPLQAPDFIWHTKEFHLYESISTAKGVRYVIKKTWRLVPALTPRNLIS